MKRRIFVVEDNLSLLESTPSLLKEEGYCCLNSNTRLDTVNILEKEKADPVISDIMIYNRMYSVPLNIFENIPEHIQSLNFT